MGQKLVLYKESCNIMRETKRDNEESVSYVYSALSTNVNLGSFPLFSFSDNWEYNWLVFPYVNLNVKS